MKKQANTFKYAIKITLGQQHSTLKTAKLLGWANLGPGQFNYLDRLPSMAENNTEPNMMQKNANHSKLVHWENDLFIHFRLFEAVPKKKKKECVTLFYQMTTLKETNQEFIYHSLLV